MGSSAEAEGALCLGLFGTALGQGLGHAFTYTQRSSSPLFSLKINISLRIQLQVSSWETRRC